MSILDEMKVRRLYCDGGMGSLLQAAGLAAGELPERWNISHPEVITDVHRKYLAAGADIMTTNTLCKACRVLAALFQPGYFALQHDTLARGKGKAAGETVDFAETALDAFVSYE